MSTSEVEIRNINLTMQKSMENLVIPSQDAIGQSISQALTFSGVITQNPNQILHENKSISRSPSPSLRSAECASDNIDNDKTSDTSLNLQSQTGGSDSGSVSSGDVPTVIEPTPLNYKNDNSKVTSSNLNPKGVEGGGTVRAKKKSWYNALYPTYKSKSDDFKRIFKDLPDDERLIVDYSCALQKDILAHGRLYASQNYLCFYASIFGWETNLTLRWKDVTAITKEKTALVIPNAILVCSEGEKHFLASFSGRDKAYLMLFRIWQNALMDQPTSSQEIWQWVHTCYGEELGLNSDEEGYMRDGPEDLSAFPSETPSEDLLDSSSMDASGGADTKDDHKVGRSISHTRDTSPPLVTNGDAEDNEEAGDTLPTDMSDTSDSEPDKPNHNAEMERCTESHDGKLILKQQFPFNIDHVFTMIFTNSRFQLELLAARSATDYVQAPWQVQNGRKCRQISYRLSLSTGPIGPKEVQVTETQVTNKCSKPGVLYSIDCTSENSGIPYADYISVVVHYCMQRVSESSTDLALYASIKYKRSMWPVVKSFMEKSAIAGVEEFSRLLESRLAAEADRAAPPARAARRHRRTIASSQEISVTTAAISPASTLLAPRASVSRAALAPSRSRTNLWLCIALVLLLVVNAVLYYRLYHSAGPQTLDLEDLQNRMSSVSDAQMADWSKLLEQHSSQQRGQLLAWRQALDKTVAHLAQTEQALTKLLETIKPSLESVQREPEAERNEL